MIVIVYLREPKCYTVVPEEFIMDLKEKNVKNYGINRNQARRIYFSKEWFENQANQVNLNQRFAPNFRLPCTTLYPLANNMVETNFEGRMILFEETFAAAIQKANDYRPQMPAVYNTARENERPIPRIELSAVEINEQNSDEQNSGEQEEEEENPEQSVPENVQGDDQEDLQSTFFDSVVLNPTEVDVKPVMHAGDIDALDNLFGEAASNQIDPLADDVQQGNVDSNHPQSNVSEASESFGNGIVQESTRNDAVGLVQNATVPDVVNVENVGDEMQQNEQEQEQERERQIAENARKVLLYGKKVVFDFDVEYMSLPDQKLEAIMDEPKYEVKTNDLLSGNKACKKYVSNNLRFLLFQF